MFVASPFILPVYLLLFLLLSLGGLYFIGYFFLGKEGKNIEGVEAVALSICLGVILFVYLAIILGFLNLRYLFLPIILFFSIYSILKYRFNLLTPWKEMIGDKKLMFIIFLGILTLGFINFPSGYIYNKEMFFWSSQGFDGLWHVSLMEEIKKTFPPQLPIFSGEGLRNYHYLVDVFMGEHARIYPFFSPLDLYFRFFPIFFSFLIGVTVFSLVHNWKENKFIGYWALFFTFFTGSFGYIVVFLRNREIFGGETVFWASQLNTIIGNPPHAIAISLLCASLLALLLYYKNSKKRFLLIVFVLASSLAGFKVSGGIVFLIGLGLSGVINMIAYRNFSIFLLFILLSITNFFTLKLMTKGVESYLIFSPWWFIRTMVVVKLDWVDLEHKRQHYISKGTWHAWLRVIQLESTAFSIFLFGNLGMRVLGFLDILKPSNLKKIFQTKSIDAVFAGILISSFLIPMLFLQKGIVYNSIQFIQYFLLIFGFYAAVSTFNLIKLIKNNILKIIFICVVISLSVPTVIGNFVEFYNRPPLAKISARELAALEYIKNNSAEDDIILSPSFNQYAKDRYKNQPWPIYAWSNTAYVSGLTSRRTYLSNEDMADQTGFPVEARRNEVRDFFEKKDLVKNKKFLTEKEIDLVYVRKDELDNTFDGLENGLDKYFENEEVVVYQVK